MNFIRFYIFTKLKKIAQWIWVRMMFVTILSLVTTFSTSYFLFFFFSVSLFEWFISLILIVCQNCLSFLLTLRAGNTKKVPFFNLYSYTLKCFSLLAFILHLLKNRDNYKMLTICLMLLKFCHLLFVCLIKVYGWYVSIFHIHYFSHMY